MLIRPEDKRIPLNYTVAQLLVMLQVYGHLDDVELPGWARGSSVEKLFNVVRSLGDCEWLEGVYEDLGHIESADKWLEDYLDSKPVPDQEEAAEIIKRNQQLSLLPDLKRFASMMPKPTGDEFLAKLIEDDFKALALKSFHSLSLAFAASVGADDKEFKAIHSELTFLDPIAVADPHLSGLAHWFLTSNADYVFEQMETDPEHIPTAKKRLKALATKLKKAMPKSASD